MRASVFIVDVIVVVVVFVVSVSEIADNVEAQELRYEGEARGARGEERTIPR